jgi:FixJ family two-component response regulator
MTERAPLIYIVEDDASVLKGLERLLRAWSYEVRACRSAREFLDHAGEPVDCVVVDVHMPGQTGLQLQAELAREGRRIPIVFVTGHGDASAQQEAMSGGAVAFLKKPFTDQDLLKAVRQATGQREIGNRK